MPRKQDILEYKKKKGVKSALIIPDDTSREESIISGIVDLYITQLNAQFGDGSMKPSLDYANTLIKRSEAQPTRPGTDLFVKDEAAKLYKKSEKLKEITRDYYNTVCQKSINDVRNEATKIVNEAYGHPVNGRVDTNKIAQKATVVIHKNCAGLAKNLSTHLAKNRDDKLLAYHQNKIVEKCNLVFKGWCTFLYTVFDLKAAVKEKKSFGERFKENFDNVDIGLTKSQNKIDQSIKALNSSSFPRLTFYQAAKQVATNPNDKKVISEAKRDIIKSCVCL